MSKLTFETPILFLIFNRPNTTIHVFEKIRQIKPQYLYVAADGPRITKKGEQELTEKVRKIATNIDWDCELKTLFRDENLGCREAVSSAIDWFFENVEMGIIIEDDIIPDLSFFRFCAELLEKYKNDNKIISVSGFNFGHGLDGMSYDFSRFMSMWGWATWKRVATKVDYLMTDWQKRKRKKLFLYRVLKKNIFDIDLDWIEYWYKYFNLTSEKDLDTWDFQWIYYQLRNDLLSVFPARNLVTNIGFSSDATHTKDEKHVLASIRSNKIDFPLIHKKNKKFNPTFEENYVKRIWCDHERRSLFKIFKNFILRIGYKTKFILRICFRLNKLIKH